MKKINLVLLIGLILVVISACGNKMSVGGESYDSKFVESGYYLDKATLSDAAFVDALSKIEEIEKPKSLGKVQLPDFSTIELSEQSVVEVTDEMIEEELERERDQETSYEPIKTRRDAELKDKVIIDFKGYQNGVEFEGGSAEDYELVLGSGQFIPGFEDQIVGHAAGRKFKVNVTFPQEYDEKLAGKPAVFDVTIKSIEEPVTPQIDNAFVVRHTKTGSFNPDEYREEVKHRIEKRNEFLSNQSTIYELYRKLYEETKFEPTEQAIAWQFSAMIQQYKSQAEQNGTNLATLIAEQGLSVKEFYDNIKSYAPQVIESTMLLDELKKTFKVNVTDDDIKNWFDTMSDAYGYGNQITFDQYIEYVGKENVKNNVLEEKTLMKAAEKCKRVSAENEE